MQYNKATPEIKNKVRSFIDQNKEQSAPKLVALIQKKFNIIISERVVSYQLANIKKTLNEIWEELITAIEQINEEEDKKPYEVIEKWGELCYSLATQKQTFIIPVAQIDRMFKDFSRKGNNLSGEAMRTKYKLKPEAWNAIKSKLSLYKDSHVVSPHTLESLSPEDEAKVVQKAIEDHIDTKVDKFTNTYEREFKKRAEQALKEKANFEYRLEKLREVIEKHKPIELDFEPVYINKDDEAVNYVLTDIHLGKIDTAWVIRRLDAMLQDIVNSKAQTVQITCLWDLVETLAGGWMHPNQIEYWTDASYWYWYDALMRTVTIFEKWLHAIAKSGKKVYFKWLTWNHWRFTQNKEDDHWRTWELVIYEMIKRGVSQLGIDVEYFKERINVFVFDGIQYIIHHGDWNIGNQTPEKLIVSHADFWMYTVILSGDKHNLKMSEWKNYTQIQVPALAWQGRYDKDMNLHSESWYVKVLRNTYDTVDVIIKRLK